MIRCLTGKLIDHNLGSVILDVQGVGYLVATPINGTALKQGDTLTFWTHLAVRETALDLYGFTNRDDLALFEQLLTIPKIGPKSALQILNQADGETIKKSVATDDPAYLSKVTGIGKKTAEKIVLGLKNVFDDYTYSVDESGNTTQAAFSADAVDALIALGYPPADARKVVQQLPPEVNTTNEAVKAALQLLGQV